VGREDLEASIATVRDIGNSGINGDVALRDAINQGQVVGPRLLSCAVGSGPVSRAPYVRDTGSASL
jgi:hypothetical protein